MADNAAEPRPDPPLTTVDPRLISTKPKLPDARLEQIRQREQAATPGPWHVLRAEAVSILSHDEHMIVDQVYEEGALDAEVADLDAEFIAHARADIPYLLAELTRLRAERDDQAKHAQNGECPICVERGILPSQPYGCYVHSQMAIDELKTAEAERDEAQHRLALFKNQLSVQEERTASWHQAYDALHAQLEQLKRDAFLVRDAEQHGPFRMEVLAARQDADRLRVYKDERLAVQETPPSLAIHNRALLKENMKLLDQLAAQETPPVEEMRLRAYRQARVFEPSMEGYHAAMSVYAAAFGKPDGEPTVMLPDGSTKQGWELSTFAAQETAGWQPIETAKGNTPVLVADDEGNYSVRLGLAAAFESTDWSGRKHRYTRWMPLPSLPARSPLRRSHDRS